MSEIRLNILTREWVIVSAERAMRPTDYIDTREKKAAPAHLPSCPFCLGNERKTADEYFRLSEDGGWKIRVVANRYPALSFGGERKQTVDGLKRSVSAVGRHEIIIETPAHDLDIASYDLKHIEDLIRIYRGRFNEAHADPRVEHVIIFKNHGEGSGTTIEHPHTQLVAVPVVPMQFRKRVEYAMHYFDDTGQCLVCSMIGQERADGVRVVIDTEHFLTFIPYAALSPFHTWIFPKRHCATFSGITDDEAKDLAFHMKTLFAKFKNGLEDPAYNYVIRSSRLQDGRNEYCHWYLSVVPRITKTAGFELGSGMFINTEPPEESAAFLRGVVV